MHANEGLDFPTGCPSLVDPAYSPSCQVISVQTRTPGQVADPGANMQHGGSFVTTLSWLARARSPPDANTHPRPDGTSPCLITAVVAVPGAPQCCALMLRNVTPGLLVLNGSK